MHGSAVKSALRLTESQSFLAQAPSSQAPVTQESLLADVVRAVVAHEDEIQALKFNHSFLMYASIKEPLHLYKAQASYAQVSLEEPPRIVIWKALMHEVMKRLEEAISREKQDPAAYEAALALSIVQEHRQGQKVRMLPTEAAVTHNWPYVKWDEASNKLIQDTSKDPLSTNLLNSRGRLAPLQMLLQANI